MLGLRTAYRFVGDASICASRLRESGVKIFVPGSRGIVGA
jgi:hypothetical protein